MANETAVQASCTQEYHQADEYCENIPPGGTTAAAGTSKLKVHVGDIVGYSQPSRENEPLPDTCTCSTPAPSSSIHGVKTKSRLSGLQSALTPILKYLNIGNKCPSPEPLTHGNSPNTTVPPFCNTMANSQKSTGDSSQHSNSDFSSSHSGRPLSDTNAPVCWLADECLPEITLLDVTSDTAMQLTKNDSALPESVPSTPVRAESVNAYISPQSSQSRASANLNTTSQISCTQKKTMDVLQSSIGSPKTKTEATDQATSVSKNTTETSLVMNHSSSDKTGGSCDVQDVGFDKPSLQKSTGNIVLSKARTTTFYPRDDSFNTKPPKQSETITGSEKTTVNKPSPPRVCIAIENHSQIHPYESSKYNNRTASKDQNAKMVDIPESIDAPLRWLDDRYFPEITLLEVTRDSEFSPGGDMSSLDVTQDIPSVDTLQNNVTSSALSGQVFAEPGTLDMIQNEDSSSTLDGNVTQIMSSMSEQSDKCVGENIAKDALEVARDISMGSVLEDSQPSSEPSGQNMTKLQTSAVDTLGTLPANVTRDISSSSDMSVQCAASQFSPSDTQCDTSPKNVTSVPHAEPVVTSNSVETNNEEPFTSHDADSASKVLQPSPKTAGFVNSTFTIVEQFNLSASPDANTAAQIPCSQNKKLDLPPSNPTAESHANDQATSVSQNTIETSPVIHQKRSSVNSSGPCDVQNITFDRHSLQKSTDSAVSVGVCATTCRLQNNTFDKCPSKQNGTITVSETTSSESHHKTLVLNATSSTIDNNSEVHPPELSKHNVSTASSDPDAKMVDMRESTFETNPAVEVASADQCKTKDHSPSGLPLRDGLSDTVGNQSMDMVDVKGNTLNLDDTLDLNSDALITSTPMTNCKMFNWNMERQEGKIIGAQKKLYREGPNNPVGQVPSDTPSNVCDRKTFLTQPAPTSLLPPLKAASQLLKYKPASTLPGRSELMSGLPMTRQRTQAEALRNTATSDAPNVTTGTSASYSLRATTVGSKQPNPGLRKPWMSGIPSGIQRAAPGLKAPSARSNVPASLSTDKLCETTVTNPATKIFQARKHTLIRGEALSTAKRKKTDDALPSGNSEPSTSSCDAATRAKSLKQPTTSQKALPAKTQRAGVPVQASTAETSSCNAVSRIRALKQPVTSHRTLLPKSQGHGCAKCVMLEQQLEMKSEEIKRLKEDLLKYRKVEEEC